MKDLAIAIRIGSVESDKEKVKGTIESITKNIGVCDYRFFLSLIPIYHQRLKQYIYLQQKESPSVLKY